MEHIGNKLGDDKYWFEIMEHSCNRSIAENPEKEGDFMQDGFLHCGTCKEPKREMYERHGFTCLTSRKCKCIRDAEEAEEKRKKYEERMAKVARLRSQSLMDEMFYKAAGTRIASTTSPQVYFATLEDNTISRSSCNSVVIRVMQVAGEGHYTVWLNDTAYTYLSQTEDDKMAILEGLRSSITDNDFTVSINTDDEFLVIQSKNKYLSHSIDMTENLSTEEVTSIIIFESEEYKRIQLTEGAITEIITSTAGFSRCTNLAIPVYGRERETDAELRQSYARKQSYRSSTLLESITSAIMNNVAEISSAVAFENDTDLTDSEGRPPHSIEVVADGGDEAAIAQQILLYKAAGIQTFGKEVVDVPTSFGTTVAVRFNRPVPVYVWLKVSVVKNPEEAMPPNYEELIKSAIMSYAENIRAGENIVIQKVITPINTLVSGLAYISIKAYTSQDIEAIPTDTDYNLTYITVASREKAYFDEERIEVVVDEN